MPEGGFLLANAFESGRTMLFDLRQPQHPSLITSFGDLDGYMHPHTYVRLPNGHVLATFQYHGGHGPKSDGGGLVEFDDDGHFIHSSSAMDAAAKGELIRPYSLVVVPAFDRIVSTNMAMHEKDGDSRTVQVWRLSDLKLLRTSGVAGGAARIGAEIPWRTAPSRRWQDRLDSHLFVRVVPNGRHRH